MATQYTAGLTTGQVLTAATMNQIGAVWETWTPVISQPGTITFTNQFARYARLQKIVIATFSADITGAGTAGNNLYISLPITANNVFNAQGSGVFYDASTNTLYSGTFAHISISQAGFYGDWAAGGLWGTVPNLAIANGDKFRGTFIYEAA